MNILKNTTKFLAFLFAATILSSHGCVKKNEIITFQKECGTEPTIISCFENFNACLDASKVIKDSLSTGDRSVGSEGHYESCVYVFEICEQKVDRYLDCKLDMQEKNLGLK